MSEETYVKLDCPFDFTSRCTMGRCDCKPVEEPKDVLLGYKTSIVAQMLDESELKEPKQETIYEAAEKLITSHPDFKTEGFSDYQNGRLNGIIEGAELQAKRMYSDEHLKNAFRAGFTLGYGSDVHGIYKKNELCDEWFKRYTNK